TGSATPVTYRDCCEVLKRQNPTVCAVRRFRAEETGRLCYSGNGAAPIGAVMAQQMQTRGLGRSFNGVAEMPTGRPITVRSGDGTRLHAEVFGPYDGYPIVLSHGITCALRVWFHQIADLSVDHRVIAFDHRGHGRSEVPRRDGYSLD